MGRKCETLFVLRADGSLSVMTIKPVHLSAAEHLATSPVRRPSCLGLHQEVPTRPRGRQGPSGSLSTLQARDVPLPSGSSTEGKASRRRGARVGMLKTLQA